MGLSPGEAELEAAAVKRTHEKLKALVKANHGLEVAQRKLAAELSKLAEAQRIAEAPKEQEAAVRAEEGFFSTHKKAISGVTFNLLATGAGIGLGLAIQAGVIAMPHFVTAALTSVLGSASVSAWAATGIGAGTGLVAGLGVSAVTAVIGLAIWGIAGIVRRCSSQSEERVEAPAASTEDAVPADTLQHSEKGGKAPTDVDALEATAAADKTPTAGAQ